MKSNTKSSITLPANELKLILSLQARLKAKSKVEVVRRGLRLLQETTDRESMREAYRRASLATRKTLAQESLDSGGYGSASARPGRDNSSADCRKPARGIPHTIPG